MRLGHTIHAAFPWSPPARLGALPPVPANPLAFITRWTGIPDPAERANYQAFLLGLCDVLDVPHPDPAPAGGLGPYRFEREVEHVADDDTRTRRRMDLYKQDCFILEAKGAGKAATQNSLPGLAPPPNRRSGPAWAARMRAAKGQAVAYAQDLPPDEPPPPFLVVCDIGRGFDLYADFSRTGRHYAMFPDRSAYHIPLADLANPASRRLLHDIWTNPDARDPGKRRLAVTRANSAFLAKLSKVLEGPPDRPRYDREAVAHFLIRAIFSMYAQSAGLLTPGTFTTVLESGAANLPAVPTLLGQFWRTMDAGGFWAPGMENLRHFNGGLFAPNRAQPVIGLALDTAELATLLDAARKDWSEVEPAIFGTLLEEALDAPERARLGAHFTPRAFVERLIQPTIMEPLRDDWSDAQKAALKHLEDGDRAAATRAVRDFHAKLCGTTVLDPACGTGNFLAVAFEEMKALEGEVLAFLQDLDPTTPEPLDLPGSSVTPGNFLGVEKNLRAVPVAELVLWIAWLQWHVRTRPGREIPEPILRDFANIEGRDALLESDSQELLTDDRGIPITRQGPRRTLHPITGEEIPDPADRVPLYRPVNPRRAPWPRADFIVGNPPFIGGKDLRAELGDGECEALWKVDGEVPPSADLAMHFWRRAAEEVAAGRARRFGFITTNSITQVFSRRVVADALAGKVRERGPALRLVMAVPNHPWAVGPTAADVRIAMTVADAGEGPGRLLTVKDETATADDVPVVTFHPAREGRVNADLTIGVDVTSARPLRANENLCSPGVKLHGDGFIVTPAVARSLGLGRIPGAEDRIRPYLNGRDLNNRARGLMVLDLFGLTEPQLRTRFPEIWQHVHDKVKPERDANRRATYRDNWWIFGEPRRVLRSALNGLPRYVATVETSKHRFFTFLPAEVLPDNKLVALAFDDAFHLGILSSRLHVAWALAAGGRLGVGDDPVYVKTLCFDTFPFPDPTPAQRAEVAAIAEELDAHRKARIAARPHLTLTALYNVLEALRANRTLSASERDIHEAGLVSLLRTLHDRLDAAVAAAYGWDPDSVAREDSAAPCARVLALNAARAAEEAAGRIRWLRPAFQQPQARVQTRLAVPEAGRVALRLSWPEALPDQFAALRAALAAGPADLPALRRRLAGAPRAGRLKELLAVMKDFGQVRELAGDRYAA